MRIFLLHIVCFLLIGCSGDKPEPIERAFYHWKSDFEISEEQDAFLNEINADVLYVKYFDVVLKHDGPAPVAEIEPLSTEVRTIIPTVYITTAVFSESDSLNLSSLAANVANLIRTIHGPNELQEIQIDCDWNEGIKERYFEFLERIKAEFPNTLISATIRLYQYKYPQFSGVPPVDKGLLMYYNMGDFWKYGETNSILDNALGELYLGFNEYSLPIDIALPNFEWSLLFREGKFEQICHYFTAEDFKNEELFTSYEENHYLVKKDTVIDNTYFRFGDELRHEFCSEMELLKAAELLKKEINQETTRVVIYDLQKDTPNDYEKLNTVFNAFN